MIDSNFIKNTKLGIQNVSRETLDDLNNYSLSILKKNKDINLISSSTEKSIDTRHIADSAQIIDFIDKNDIKICTDLGSGAGLPGVVLAILMKPKKPQFKVIFYEKSYNKSKFLKEVSKKFLKIKRYTILLIKLRKKTSRVALASIKITDRSIYLTTEL